MKKAPSGPGSELHSTAAYWPWIVSANRDCLSDRDDELKRLLEWINDDSDTPDIHDRSYLGSGPKLSVQVQIGKTGGSGWDRHRGIEARC